MSHMMPIEIEELSPLLGETICDMWTEEEGLYLVTEEKLFVLQHDQQCCEDVRLEDICGNLGDLVGAPIVVAERRLYDAQGAKDEGNESSSWTYFELATIKGSVTIRFYGSSNGYYSEDARLYILPITHSKLRKRKRLARKTEARKLAERL